MQLLQIIHSCGASKEKQSCVVWRPSLTQENKDDLERAQNLFAKRVWKDKYINMKMQKIVLNWDSVDE